ncbi:peptide synthetase [Streptomyces sp. JV178]|uniref:fatty acyl-AMP ligase n=1 Tax=Streptomyces sp. JV178 TaxID=858632 RepID=UPI000C1B523F|nr:fatty acyl-AMP ligase [Streptomyces sp. JV178]PIM66912.1 peptide synthetase [Streptomyces sp. JV178]
MPELITSLRERAARDPHEPAVFFVSGSKEFHGSSRTFSELELSARRTASWLQERYKPGDRALLVHSPGLEFVTAFFGCLYAGLIAVPAPVPARSGHQHRRLAAIARDAGVRVLLTQEEDRATMEKWAAEAGVDGLTVHTTDAGDGDGDPAAWSEPPVSPDTVALLQYTSGSTGDPKGVMVSHGNLLTNGQRIFGSIGLDTTRCSARTGGWIPLYHDMGLIGLMLPGILLGRGYAQLDPVSFLRNPYQWLRMMDSLDINLTASPDFGYDMCVRRVTDEQLATLDLSRIAAAVNGSEPVRAGTLDRFQERFGPAGFRPEAMLPMYGLAEATLMASGTGGRKPVTTAVGADGLERGLVAPATATEPSRTLTGCGADTGSRALIVDPETARVLPDGRIGEIWLSGPCVAGGYWGNEPATQATFRARTADGQGPFLRTGDLGGRLDGDLYITGRRKEVLVVHGRNVYPHDIEDELRLRHEELDDLLGAVFLVGGADGVRAEPAVVAVHETRPQPDTERLRSLAAAMKQTIAREFGVPVGAVVLVRPRSVRRTTSGKIQRSAMRDLYLTGQLEHFFLSEDPQLTSALADHRERGPR